MPTPKIYYLAPDFDTPSWGAGMLYHHVRLLRDQGFDAYVLHQKRPFRISWTEVDVPIAYRNSGLLSPRFQPDSADILVVPEVQAHTDEVASFQCRRVVFVQGGFLILNAFDRAISYPDLGFEAAMAVLPHIRDIVSRHFGLKPVVIPPFVAPYFFTDPDSLDRQRRKRILIAGKADYRKAGYLDYDIASKLIARFIADRPDWELTELAGLDHRQTAETMRDSSFLVNVNLFESFNAIVPEAMAAGCLPFCYEAYGGQDFLQTGRNAFVWPNNYIYPMIEGLFETIDRYDDRKGELDAMRRAAFETVSGFNERRTAQALAEFFGPRIAA